MGSKSKWIGLIILLAVIGAAAVYLLLGGGPQPEPAVLRGYVLSLIHILPGTGCLRR